MPKVHPRSRLCVSTTFVPRPPSPLPDSGWINRTEVPFALHIGHPANPLPVSGIKGYAVAIDRQPTTEPCASPTLCTEAETDLQGGIGNDSFPVFDLPEGVSYAHAVAVSESGMRSAQAGHAMLRVDKTDPVTSLIGAPGGWTNQPVILTANAADALSGMQPGGEGAEPFTALRIDDNAPVISVGDSATAAIAVEGTHNVAYYARDLAGNVNDGEGADMDPLSATVRIDRTPPAVAFADAQDPADPEQIVAHISDPLSGPNAARGQIEIRRLGSGGRFDSLPTEVAAGVLRARWDSESYPDGEYELRAVGFDAAGNSTAASLRGNGTTMTLRNPLKAPTELPAAFGGVHLRKRARYGGGALYKGRLSAARGASVADLPVKIVERFPAGASQPERITTVRTDGGGAFAINLLPGPSRQVTAIFDGTRNLHSAKASTSRLAVRGSVRMRTSSRVARVGGRAIVFRGRVGAVGAGIPSGGKSVQLQFHLRGVPWTEFRTVQTDRHGRFRYAYRFTDNDSRGIRFRFRAFAPPQGGWPYGPAASRPIAVMGR